MGWLLFLASMATLCYGLLHIVQAEGIYVLVGLILLCLAALIGAEAA